MGRNFSSGNISSFPLFLQWRGPWPNLLQFYRATVEFKVVKNSRSTHFEVLFVPSGTRNSFKNEIEGPWTNWNYIFFYYLNVYMWLWIKHFFWKRKLRGHLLDSIIIHTVIHFFWCKIKERNNQLFLSTFVPEMKASWNEKGLYLMRQHDILIR